MKTNTKRVASIGLLYLTVTGCSPSQEKLGKDGFDPNKIAYFKDSRTDICFAVISYSRMDTGGKLVWSISHSAVPCTPKVEELIK